MTNINGLIIDENDFYIGKFYKRKTLIYDSWCITNGQYFLGLTSEGRVEKTTKYKSAFYSKNYVELETLFAMAKDNGESYDGYYLEKIQTVRDEMRRYTLKNNYLNNNTKKKRRSFSKTTRKIVYKKSDGKCAICGCQLSLEDVGADNYMSIDHIIPLDKGGKNDISNYQACCRSCNALKANIMPKVFNNSFQSVLFQTIIDDKQKQNELLTYLCRLKTKQVMKHMTTLAAMFF